MCVCYAVGWLLNSLARSLAAAPVFGTTSGGAERSRAEFTSADSDVIGADLDGDEPEENDANAPVQVGGGVAMPSQRQRQTQ